MSYIVEDKKELKDILENLEEKHTQIIFAWRKYIVGRCMVVILPIMFGTLLRLFATMYMLPRGMISEFHEYGPYEPVTMQEIHQLFWFSHILSWILVLNFVMYYHRTSEKATYYDNEKHHQFLVIGEVSTTAGVIKFGPRLVEKSISSPRRYMNFNGISFDSPDVLKIHQMGQATERELTYLERAVRHATSTIKSIQITENVSRDGDNSGAT